MKKVIISVTFIFAFTLFSCRTSKPVIQESGKGELKTFFNEYLFDKNGKRIVPKKVVEHTIFYNSGKLNGIRQQIGTEVSAENGVMNILKNVDAKLKSVLVKTEGSVVDVKENQTGITGLKISFDQNDSAFTYWFMRANDGRFYVVEDGEAYLNGSRSQFEIEKNVKLGDVYLLFEINKFNEFKTDKQTAKGNRTGASNN